MNGECLYRPIVVYAARFIVSLLRVVRSCGGRASAVKSNSIISKDVEQTSATDGEGLGWNGMERGRGERESERKKDGRGKL
jgi:hypothetical protein